MKSLLKIFTILPRDQYRMCIFILLAMFIGAMLEAVGIGAVLPLISLMGNENFLSEHLELAEIVATIGLDSHEKFIIAIASLLIVVYLLKNIYIVWESHLQIRFAVKNQVYYSKELLAEYLNFPRLKVGIKP